MNDTLLHLLENLPASTRLNASIALRATWHMPTITHPAGQDETQLAGLTPQQAIEIIATLGFARRPARHSGHGHAAAIEARNQISDEWITLFTIS